MGQATICLVILIATVGLFVWGRLPAEIVAVGSALTLYATGLVPIDELFAGFGDQVIVLLATLFILGEALGAAGVTTWVGRRLAARAALSNGRLLLCVLLVAAGLAGLITGNGAVATLTPLAVLLAVQRNLSPSRLAMPLAFAAHAGSLLTLAGSPVNMIVSEAAAREVGRPFGYVEFALVGVPLVAGTLALITLFGRRLVPDRTPRVLPPDLTQHARTLLGQYIDDDTHRLRIRPGSPAVGAGVDTLHVRAPDGPVVIGATAADGHPRGTGPLEPGDVLVVRGDAADVGRFADRHHLTPLPEDDHDPDPARDQAAGALLNRDLGVAEVLVTPRSSMIGDRVFPGMATESGDLVVLAIHRQGHDLGPAPSRLAVGDVLLLQGPWPVLHHRIGSSPDVLAVHQTTSVQRQAVTLGRGALPALAALAAMVVMLATGIVPPAVAGLISVGALVLLRVLTMRQAYDSVSWNVLVVVAGMFPMSFAIRETGAAAQIADIVVAAVGGNPHLLLLGLFLLTATLGQVVSNLATVLIVIPIAVAAAHDTGTSPAPVLMTIAIAGAAAFLTPIATSANLMVSGPGGYRFGDYWRLGLPLLGWFLLVALVLVPVLWPL